MTPAACMYVMRTVRRARACVHWPLVLLATAIQGERGEDAVAVRRLVCTWKRWDAVAQACIKACVQVHQLPETVGDRSTTEGWPQNTMSGRDGCEAVPEMAHGYQESGIRCSAQLEGSWKLWLPGMPAV